MIRYQEQQQQHFLLIYVNCETIVCLLANRIKLKSLMNGDIGDTSEWIHKYARLTEIQSRRAASNE